jgi:hypothetical protein
MLHKTKFSLPQGDMDRFLKDLFFVIICVLSLVGLYGAMWEHPIYYFEKKNDIGPPTAVLMNSEGIENFTMIFLFVLLSSSRVQLLSNWITTERMWYTSFGSLTLAHGRKCNSINSKR